MSTPYGEGSNPGSAKRLLLCVKLAEPGRWRAMAVSSSVSRNPRPFGRSTVSAAPARAAARNVAKASVTVAAAPGRRRQIHEPPHPRANVLDLAGDARVAYRP